MTNEDYQLEELENAAVNKSNNAKRMAAAAGLLAAGGAAGYAATNIVTGSEEPVEVLTEEDLEDVANTGANQVQEQEANPQPVHPNPQPVTHVEPTPPVEHEVDVDFDKTTHFYDEDHNLVGTAEDGAIDGHRFTLIDTDGDNDADILAYDEDGNGVYDRGEVVELEGNNQIIMGHEATQHEDVFLVSNDPEPEPDPDPYIYNIDDEKDMSDNDIVNDFDDEKTGESYSHDYAENNEDYDNGNHEEYSAHSYEEAEKDGGSDYAYDEDADDDGGDMDGGSDYAYEEDGTDDGDYGYGDVAENDTADDSFDDLGSDSFDIV